MEETIQIELDIRETVDINVSVSEVMHAVNDLPLVKKWSIIGNILTHVYLGGNNEDGELVEDDERLTTEQKEMIKKFLTKQLALL